MSGRRALAAVSLVMAVSVACLPVARAQPAPQEAPPPPVVENVPPAPPVVQNVPPGQPPPVVQNVPPGPPLVQNVPPSPPVVQPLAPEPAPVPEGRGSSGKLFLSGLGTFVLAYGLTILAGAIASAEDDPAAETLYVPVVGPLLFWDGTDRPIGGQDAGYLLLSCIFQTVGIVGIVAGLADIASGTDSEP